MRLSSFKNEAACLFPRWDRDNPRVGHEFFKLICVGQYRSHARVDDNDRIPATRLDRADNRGNVSDVRPAHLRSLKMNRIGAIDNCFFSVHKMTGCRMRLYSQDSLEHLGCPADKACARRPLVLPWSYQYKNVRSIRTPSGLLLRPAVQQFCDALFGGRRGSLIVIRLPPKW